MATEHTPQNPPPPGNPLTIHRENCPKIKLGLACSCDGHLVRNDIRGTADRVLQMAEALPTAHLDSPTVRAGLQKALEDVSSRLQLLVARLDGRA